MPRLLPLMLLCASLVAATVRAEPYDAERAQMLRVIEEQTTQTQTMTGVAVIDARVLAAMGRVPRHRFVPEPFVPYAYADTPLPLGYGQNLAQPFIVALMTHLLEVRSGDTVFETGTDTGYQAALLSELGAEVWSMEVIEPLARVATDTLRALGTSRVEVKTADGYYGWAEHGPFDRILVKEAIDHVPAPLLRQLKPGGLLVMPLGPARGPQYLSVIEKRPDGTASGRRVLPVNFAPIQGGERI